MISICISKKRQCFRIASYPTAPAQIPACGTIAPGFSEILTSAKGSHPTTDRFQGSTFEATHDAWFGNVELFQQLFEAKPIVTLSLASMAEMFVQGSGGMEIEHVEAGKITIHTKVVVVSSQLRVHRLEQFRKSAMSVILAPLGEW
jgi:hypothetical protein